MYQAYTSEDVITRLPSLDPTCFSSSVGKSKLFIGTKQGHLLAIDQTSNDKRTFASVVHRSFEKKAITDLRIVESHNLILCLTDGQLNAHEYNDGFKHVATFNKYRPVSSFASFVQMPDNRLFVLICVRKRLYLLKWLINEFDEVRLEFTPTYLADSCSLLTWCGSHALYFAVKNEYYYVRIFEEQLSSSSSGNNDELGAIRSITSTTDPPSIVNLKELGFIGLTKANQIEFYNEHGNRVPHLTSFRFSDTPIALTYDVPYLVGILPKGLVEVRSVQPEMFIQKLSFNKVSYIQRGAPGFVFVASDHAVWKLDARPLAKGNVKLLTDEKHFELAVSLAEQTPQFDQKEMITLKRKLATNLFLQREFEKCFSIHLEINTDVLLVMNLIPKLIPKKYLHRLSKYPHAELEEFENNGIELPRNELKQALNPLADFLLEKRMEFGRKLDQHQKAKRDQRKDLLLGSKEVQRLRDGLELVHTVMLKCYLKTKPMLIASLLKLPDNSCIFEEAEQDLKDASLPSELLTLYERKEKHKEALELLKEQAHLEGSPLHGLGRIVEYLQELSEEHLSLIFDHAKWIIAEDFERGVEIFVGENAQTWECEEVLHFLRHECRAAIIPYLEHVINQCGEKRPKLHETLAEQYIVMVKKLMKDYVHVLADNETTTKGGDEHGELGIYRQKLMHFLRESHFYGAQKILQLLDDHLIEEKAIVFGRLKKHREALLIYTQILADFEAAERHCLSTYREDEPLDNEVFFEFYQVCIDPGSDLPKDAFNSRLLAKKPRPNINEALKVLRNHSTKLDTIKAISLIPADAPLNKVFVALEAVLESTKNRVSSSGILLAISNLARERLSKELIRNESLKIIIDFNVDCVLCGKRISTSAFVHYPNGNIAHYFCHRNSDENSSQ